jgi:hypothetical protein
VRLISLRKTTIVLPFVCHSVVLPHYTSVIVDVVIFSLLATIPQDVMLVHASADQLRAWKKALNPP